MPIPEDWSQRIERLIESKGGMADSSLLFQKENLQRLVLVDTATSWEKLQGWLNEFDDEDDWIFRGHADATWRLATSLERATLKEVSSRFDGGQPFGVRLNHQKSERDLLFNFQRRAHHYIAHTPANEEVVDWLALMQHFGAPTRLLDWTRSPYVALYFALEKVVPAVSCAVWAIESRWLNEHAEEMARQADSQYPKGDDLRARYEYINRVLMQDTNPKAILSASPIRMNERMAAQQGLFLCNLNSIEEFELSLLRMIVRSPPPYRPVVRKLIVPKDCRIPFLKRLTRMNITTASLFPGLDGFARSLGVDLEINLESPRHTAGEHLSILGLSHSRPRRKSTPKLKRPK